MDAALLASARSFFTSGLVLQRQWGAQQGRACRVAIGPPLPLPPQPLPLPLPRVATGDGQRRCMLLRR